MSDVIKLLPDSVANQIAAGEVIQRPASVVKELVENAIDAQATQIQIILKDAGRTLIQIIDNGVGMSETDARLAFERHSTSKICKAEDLFELHTMGFRGEALASIAAIAHVELRTCRKGEQIGTKLIINASKCESQEPDVCQPGANFMIKDIFFNVPARRKFLKSNQVELNNIIKEFEKLALINYNVDFTLTHNGSILYKLMHGSFKQRITSLFGRSLDSQLIPLSTETSLVKVDGFISMPEKAKRRNYQQFFFVNGRYMRHPYFHKAVMSSYGQLIPDDCQPTYFLNFTVDPETIDVNIHPTKTEIKFENEMPIWQILSAAAKETLGKFIAVPTIDFDNTDAPDIPAFNANGGGSPTEPSFTPNIEVDSNYNPFKVQRGGGSQPAARPQPVKSGNATNWEELYKNFEKNRRESYNDVTESDLEGVITVGSKLNAAGTEPVQAGTGLPFSGSEQDSGQHYLQLQERYIVSQVKSGLMVIDQHRAHVLVLYEKYMSHINGKLITSQSVMFPDVLHLTPAQDVILEGLQEGMEKLGFSLSRLSGNDWSVNSVPTGLDSADVNDTVIQVIESVGDGSGEQVKDKLYQKMALTVARRGAIPYGRKLSAAEMEHLVASLMQLPQPNHTPDGKTVIAIIGNPQIEKLF